MTSRVEICQDASAVAERAAAAMASDVVTAVARHGSATWVAAGGSTPAAAYDVIAQRYSESIPWSSVSILMGDERCVPLGHAGSNWHQLADRLLASLALADGNHLRPAVELGAEIAADQYEATLDQLEQLPTGFPRLDHVWLGIGEDGHTLSLFPNHPTGSNGRRWVVPVYDSPKPPPDRVTLTIDALAGAVHCLILGTGASKRDVIAQALNGDVSLPIAHAAEVIEASGGNVTWILDETAVGRPPPSKRT